MFEILFVLDYNDDIIIKFMEPQKKQQQEGLSKIEAGQQFNKIFENESNSSCFQCGKKSKQWAETKHAIFLCLNCAAIYRQVTKVINVKSIGLDLWKQEEIKLLKSGGNAKFKKYLEKYGLEAAEPKVLLRSRAAEYYRRKLKAQSKGQQIGEAPTVEQGKQPFVADIPLTQMTTDQMITQAKQRLSWAGQKTKQYGSKAYEKVHHKITSGQLKEDAKVLGDKISTGAKSLFAFVSSKIDGLRTKSEITKQAASL